VHVRAALSLFTIRHAILLVARDGSERSGYHLNTG
jgi:hypothetical protein